MKKNLSDEDLLKIAEGESFSSDSSTDNLVVFLDKYGIKPGTTTINGKLLFRLYKSHTKTYLTHVSFNSLLMDFLPVYRFYHNKTWYQIDMPDTTKDLLSTFRVKRKRNIAAQRDKHFKNFFKWAHFKPGKLNLPLADLYEMYDYWLQLRKKHNKTSMYTLMKYARLYYYVNFENEQFYIPISKSTYDRLKEKKAEKQARASQISSSPTGTEFKE